MNETAGGFPREMFVKFDSRIQNDDSSNIEISDFVCGICLDILRQPVQCPIGHMFCSTCILPIISMSGRCPNCQEVLTASAMGECLLVKNIIAGFKVRCTSPPCLSGTKCPWTGKLASLTLHFDTCPNHLVMCTHEGCEQYLSRRDIIDHLSICPQMMINCDLCEMMEKVCNMDDHLKICPSRPVRCPIIGCEATFEAKDLAVHQQNCGWELIPCPLSEENLCVANCPKMICRKDVEAHLSSPTTIAMMMRATIAMKKQSNKSEAEIQLLKAKVADAVVDMKKLMQKSEAEIQLLKNQSHRSEAEIQLLKNQSNRSEAEIQLLKAKVADLVIDMKNQSNRSEPEEIMLNESLEEFLSNIKFTPRSSYYSQSKADPPSHLSSPTTIAMMMRATIDMKNQSNRSEPEKIMLQGALSGDVMNRMLEIRVSSEDLNMDGMNEVAQLRSLIRSTNDLPSAQCLIDALEIGHSGVRHVVFAPRFTKAKEVSTTVILHTREPEGLSAQSRFKRGVPATFANAWISVTNSETSSQYAINVHVASFTGKLQWDVRVFRAGKSVPTCRRFNGEWIDFNESLYGGVLGSGQGFSCLAVHRVRPTYIVVSMWVGDK